MAYLPFIDLLKASCEIAEGEAEPAVIQRVRTALEKVGLAAQEFAPALLPLLAIQGDGAAMSDEGTEMWQRKIFVALQALLWHESCRCPLILILENLHWMDTISEELLTFLVDSIQALPVLLLTTYRPGYNPPWGDRSHHTRLILESLAEGECAALVEELLHTRAVGADVQAFIFKQAEGNPFYVEELTRSLLEMRATCSRRAPSVGRSRIRSRTSSRPGSTDSQRRRNGLSMRLQSSGGSSRCNSSRALSRRNTVSPIVSSICRRWG
jgi:predicted ATPase